MAAIAVLAAGLTIGLLMGAGAGSASVQARAGTQTVCTEVAFAQCEEFPTFCVNGSTVQPDSIEWALYLYYVSFLPGSGVTIGACPTAPLPQGPDRYVYCAASGNTDANGNPLGVGQTLNLKLGEPVTNPHYAGATLGFWVEGIGLTCQLTPAQAALAAASTSKVNHTGASSTQEGPTVYTYVPATA
jgi:hypothetical protein